MSAADRARPLELSAADARRLLTRWHFAPTDVHGVFDRHASVQYDPLRPLGTNADLVFQARVPGYRVDGWQEPVYGARAAFDGWDKQASLVRMADWPQRRIYHRWHREWWHERVFERHPEVVDDVLAELAARGPLATSDFEDARTRDALAGSWHGRSLTKHALRALWHTGRVATHHRRNGNHVYDLVERVVPPEVLGAAAPPEDAQLRFLVEARHRAVGLLRPTASRDVWSMQLSSAERREIVHGLVEDGTLIPVVVAGTRFHAHRDAVAALDDPGAGEEPTAPMRFLGPLDPLLWDRTAVARLFGFGYVWEVYKPARQRRWGYYVLPVMWGDAMVGRLDARLKGRTFHLSRFWIEDGVVADADFAAALEVAFARFLRYLGAADVRQSPSAHAVPRPVRDALYAAARAAATRSAS